MHSKFRHSRARLKMSRMFVIIYRFALCLLLVCLLVDITQRYLSKIVVTNLDVDYTIDELPAISACFALVEIFGEKLSISEIYDLKVDKSFNRAYLVNNTINLNEDQKLTEIYVYDDMLCAKIIQTNHNSNHIRLKFNETFGLIKLDVV